MMRMKSKRLQVLLGLLLLFVGALPADAHGYIVRAIPENRSTLERPPTRLQYWFSEELEPRFSAINLRDESGQIIASGGVNEDDRTLLALRVPSATLNDGAYIVELRPAFASDGHVVAESHVFFVGEAVGGVEGAAASNAAVPLEVVWKAALYTAIFVLFGAFVLYNLVLLPAWGSAKHPAGYLPPRVMRRLNRIVWVALFVAIAASLLALLQQSMVFFGVDAVSVVTGGLWQVVRIGSRFGDVWNIRMILLLAVAALHFAGIYYRAVSPGAVRAYWAANMWGLALLVGLQAINSHAAGSLVWPWVAVTMHWLHTLAVAFWVGGIAVLALLLPVALAPYTGDTRQAALLSVMRRFSHLTLGTVAVVITTGVYNSANWFFTPSDVVTTYGASLAYKLLLVGGLLFVGALHHIALRPHLLQRPPLNMLARGAGWAGQFTASLRLETVLVVLALIAAGLLSATPIPEPEFTQDAVETPSGSVTVADYTIAQTVIPGGPGVNTFDVIVERADEAPADAVRVELQIVQPERAIRSAWQAAENVEGGLYVTADDTIDAAGRWWVLVDVYDADNTLTRAFFEWSISADASVIQSRPPTALTVLALLAVLASVGYVLWPTMQRYAQRMDLSLTTLVAAIGGSILFMSVTLGAVVVVVQQQNAFNETLNPPPSIVNPVSPDAASLERGQALYQQQCIVWQSVTDFQVLLRQSPLLRDETLFDATASGWRDVPPCTGELSERQRWDIVNYFRTLRTRLS